jgi:hypothetical protein
VRAAEPPRDSFGSESFAGDYGLNPLFDAPAKAVNIHSAKAVNINTNDSAMLFCLRSDLKI